MTPSNEGRRIIEHVPFENDLPLKHSRSGRLLASFSPVLRLAGGSVHLDWEAGISVGKRGNSFLQPKLWRKIVKRPAIRMTACLAGALLGFSALTANAGTVTETVHLVVTGGPHAGTWDASSDRGGCSAGLTGPGSWGNQLSQPKQTDPAKFNSLQLIVPNAKKAAAGVKDFFILFRFGSLMGKNTEYTIETRPAEAKKKGSGGVVVDDKGATAQVAFNVTSAEGYKFVGTINCKSVVRAS